MASEETKKQDKAKDKKTEFAKSYHTFILPFVCDKNFDEKGTVVNRNGNWEKDTLTENQIICPATGEPTDEQRQKYREDYGVYQYFTPEARNLLFDAKYSYRYKIPKGAEYKYCIKKMKRNWNTQKDEPHDYELVVDSIRMLIFDNSIGIFVLETENHNDKTTLDGICEINEYGRRINLPYITDGSHALVADSITLLGETADFTVMQKEYLADCTHTPRRDIIRPIKKLICDFIGEDCDNYDGIRPVIDDRMYVCCLIRDDKFSEVIRNKPDIYSWDRLYQIGFVDVSSSSCQSKRMREEIFSRCLYDRWLDYGTIDVVTHHSFVRFTGEDREGKFGLYASVYLPFLTQYIYLAIGALLQRANIMHFSDRCSHISEQIAKDMSDNGKVSEEHKIAIEKLNSEYVDAQNRVFLYTLTAQEQGIEEFEMFKKELYIKESYDDLDRKIKSLYEMTSAYAEHEENSLLNIITRYGIPVAVVEILLSIVLTLNITEPWVFVVCVIVTLLIGWGAGQGLLKLFEKHNECEEKKKIKKLKK